MTEKYIKIKERFFNEAKIRPVVIFGAGLVGNTTAHVLKKNGINAACFCDNLPAKQGTVLEGIEIIKPEQVKERYENPVFLLASVWFLEMQEHIEKMGFDTFFTCDFLLYDFDEWEYDACTNKMQMKAYVQAYLREFLVYDGDENYLPLRLIVHITQRCSVRCRDCMALIPYFREPKDKPASEIIPYIKRMIDASDVVKAIDLIGGETFLYKELDQLIEFLLKEEKVKHISLFTNGTIVPDKNVLELLKASKIFVSISNYGKVSSMLSKIAAIFESFGINYGVMDTGNRWIDFGDLSAKEYTKEKADKMFCECRVGDRDPVVMSNGIISRCSRAASYLDLGGCADKTGDIIDLRKEKMDTDDLKKSLAVYIKNRNDAPSYCYRCNGRAWDSVPIDVAVQTKDTFKLPEE